MRTRRKLYLQKTLFTLLVAFVLSSCDEYNYKWAISKEEMEENCKDLNGYGQLVIGKTTFEEAKKQNMAKIFKEIFGNVDKTNMLVDSFDHNSDESFPIGDDLLSLSENPNVNLYIGNIDFSKIKKIGINRLHVFATNSRSCVTIDFYHNKIVSILIQNKVPFMTGISPSLIIKYKEGYGEIYENWDSYMGMKINEFHFYNKSIFMDIVNRSGNLKDKGESIHIYDQKTYSRVLSLAENEMRKIAKTEKAKKKSLQNERKSSTSYTGSSSEIYHSKYDGSPQRQFQGSVEQEEQLRQMDEMGW